MTTGQVGFRPAIVLCGLLAILGCRVEHEQSAVEEPYPETVSLLGRPLYPLEISAEPKARLEADLAAARAAYDEVPTDADAIIWLARRLGYLWQYRAAIDVLDRGVELHPGDPRMYRHRGHRQITLRGPSPTLSKPLSSSNGGRTRSSRTGRRTSSASRAAR